MMLPGCKRPETQESTTELHVAKRRCNMDESLKKLVESIEVGIKLLYRQHQTLSGILCLKAQASFIWEV